MRGQGREGKIKVEEEIRSYVWMAGGMKVKDEVLDVPGNSPVV